MAKSAIAWLLAAGKRVSKSAIIAACRNGFEQEGGIFETEPQFPDDIPLLHKYTDELFEQAEKLTVKIWDSKL